MSAHVLLDLLNELGKTIKYEALSSILSVIPDEFNKFNNAGAQMQDSIYHMTLKSHFDSDSDVKISPLENVTFFYGRQRITLRRNLHI